MGVKDFHANTRHYVTPVHISKYRGCRVGCDASGWLFRGLSPFAYEMLTNQRPWEGREDPPWVSYAMRMIYLLKDAGVEPVLVFDGCRNPAKAPTSVVRAVRRRSAQERFAAAVAAGDADAARKAAAAAAEVTPAMAHDLQRRLRAAGVQFVVAPYEADAQLAFLAAVPRSRGGIAAVLTEDSDLVAYGCDVTLFKFGVKAEGSVDEMTLSAMLETPGAAAAAAAAGAPAGRKPLCFAGWDREMVLAMCILAGCDFLPSLPQLGLKTAHKLVAEGRSLEGTLTLLATHKRWAGALTEEYAAAARRARESFLYAAVFDPVAGAPARLAPLPPALAEAAAEDTRHVGPDLDPALAHAIAHGHVNPHSLQPYDARLPPPPPEWRWTVRAEDAGRQQQQGRHGGWFAAGAAARAAPPTLPPPPRRQERAPAPAPAPAPARMDDFALMYGGGGAAAAPRQALGAPAGAASLAAAPAPVARLLQPDYDAHQVRAPGNPFARASPPGAARRAAAEPPLSFKPPSVTVSLSGVTRGPESAAAPPASRWAEFTCGSPSQGRIGVDFGCGAGGAGDAAAAPSGGSEPAEVTSPLRSEPPSTQRPLSRPQEGAWAPRPSAAATLARRGSDALSGAGASAGTGAKRKGPAGGEKRPGKKAAAMAAAAAGTLRISNFFRPAGQR